jgi:hypothetical protein
MNYHHVCSLKSIKDGGLNGIVDILVSLDGPIVVVNFRDYDPKRSIYQVRKHSSTSETNFEMVIMTFLFKVLSDENNDR